jgi:hypothetical protein
VGDPARATGLDNPDATRRVGPVLASGDATMRSLLLLLVLSTTTFGCGSNKAKDTSDHPSGGTPTASDEPSATGDHAADDKATDDLEAKRAAEAKAVDTKAAADAETVKAHAATQTQVQASFDASDRRFNELKEKIAKLSSAKKTKAKSAAAEVKTNETTVMASIAKLRDATIPQWDGAKAKVDTDMDAFNESIDALEKTM